MCEKYGAFLNRRLCVSCGVILTLRNINMILGCVNVSVLPKAYSMDHSFCKLLIGFMKEKNFRAQYMWEMINESRLFKIFRALLC